MQHCLVESSEGDAADLPPVCSRAPIVRTAPRARRGKHNGVVTAMDLGQKRGRAIMRWKNAMLRCGDVCVRCAHAHCYKECRGCLVLLSSTEGVAFAQPGFKGAHGAHTGVLQRHSSVWRSCSRAFGAWAFHVRERRRLQKVRALASHVRLEPHVVFRPSVYVRPCPCVADRAKVCQGAHSSQLVPSCPKLAGGSTHRAERFCGAGPRNTMATRICGAGEPYPIWV